MIPFKQIRTLFFDYDGTLHNTIKIYGSAFRKAYAYLVEKGLAQPKEWKDCEIAYYLGFNSTEMWKNLMPSLEPKIQNDCRNIIGDEMKSQIYSSKAVLYDGALETLQYLKEKGYHLIFISNCRTYYKEANREVFGLDRFFDKMICSEEYHDIPKYEILAKSMKRYPKEMVIIGDRIHDIEAGKKNGIYTIGCSYGFAQPDELKEADYMINDILELKNIL